MEKLAALLRYASFLVWSIEHPREANLLPTMISDYRAKLSEVQAQIEDLQKE